eukprot:8807755-Prorocentrum_lima.AAC.1
MHRWLRNMGGINLEVYNLYVKVHDPTPDSMLDLAISVLPPTEVITEIWMQGPFQFELPSKAWH